MRNFLHHLVIATQAKTNSRFFFLPLCSTLCVGTLANQLHFLTAVLTALYSQLHSDRSIRQLSGLTSSILLQQDHVLQRSCRRGILRDMLRLQLFTKLLTVSCNLGIFVNQGKIRMGTTANTWSHQGKQLEPMRGRGTAWHQDPTRTGLEVSPCLSHASQPQLERCFPGLLQRQNSSWLPSKFSKAF